MAGVSVSSSSSLPWVTAAAGDDNLSLCVSPSLRATSRAQRLLRQLRVKEEQWRRLCRPSPALYPLLINPQGCASSTSGGGLRFSGSAPLYEPVDRHFKIPHGVWMKEATSVTVDSDDNVFVFNRGNCPVLVFDPAGNLTADFGNKSPYAGTEQCSQPYPTDAFARPHDPGAGTISRFRGTEYVRPHMIRADHEDNLWLVDVRPSSIIAYVLRLTSCRIHSHIAQYVMQMGRLSQDMAHTITKCDRSGRRLLVLKPNGIVLSDTTAMNIAAGVMAEPPPAQCGRMFNRPTDACVCPRTGEIFVADGYGNSR
jgi:hypothetical protein